MKRRLGSQLASKFVKLCGDDMERENEPASKQNATMHSLSFTHREQMGGHMDINNHD